MKLSILLLSTILVTLKFTAAPTPVLLGALVGFAAGDAISDHHHKEEEKCNADQNAYMNCLETNTGNKAACQTLMERYNKCKSSH